MKSAIIISFLFIVFTVKCQSLESKFNIQLSGLYYKNVSASSFYISLENNIALKNNFFFSFSVTSFKWIQKASSTRILDFEGVNAGIRYFAPISKIFYVDPSILLGYNNYSDSYYQIFHTGVGLTGAINLGFKIKKLRLGVKYEIIYSVGPTHNPTHPKLYSDFGRLTRWNYGISIGYIF